MTATPKETFTADNYHNDPRAKAMVVAGAAWLREPDYPVLAGVTVKGAAARAGLSARTGTSRWRVDDLHIAIAKMVLTYDEDPHALFDGDQLVKEARALIEGTTVAPLDDLIAIFDRAWPTNVDDATMRAIYALWPYSTADSPLGEVIREGLHGIYVEWGERIRSIIESFIVHHGGRIRFRDELYDLGDVSVFISGLAEMAGFHARIREANGSPMFDLALPGNLLRAWLAHAFEIIGDNEHPVDRYLDRLGSTQR